MKNGQCQLREGFDARRRLARLRCAVSRRCVSFSACDALQLFRCVGLAAGAWSASGAMRRRAEAGPHPSLAAAARSPAFRRHRAAAATSALLAVSCVPHVCVWAPYLRGV